MFNEQFKKYGFYLILFVLVCIAICVSSFDFLNGVENKTTLMLDSKSYALYEIDNNYYINIDDLKEIERGAYYDKLSRMVIITTKDSVLKYGLNMLKRSANFNQEDTIDSSYIKVEDMGQFSVKELASIRGERFALCDIINTANIIRKDTVEGVTTNNRVEVYLDLKKGTKVTVNIVLKVQVVIDEYFCDSEQPYYRVVFELNGKRYVGYLLKKLVMINEAPKCIDESESVAEEFNVFYVEDYYKKIENKGVIVDTFKLRSATGDISTVTDNMSFTGESKIYAMFSNGYRYSNYDSSLTTSMISSADSRQNCIKQLVNICIKSNINGIVVNFREIKGTDKEYYIQFLKELTSYSHANGIATCVYVLPDVSYIDLESAVKSCDYAILVAHGEVSISSKVSMAASSVTWTKTLLDSVKDQDKPRVIVELPLYSILWTEKSNVAIDADIYYMNSSEDYIVKNNLTKSFDESSGLNYVEQARGSLKYKMWIEDDYSVKSKITFIKQNGFGGVSLYKKGYETYSLESILEEVINEK